MPEREREYLIMTWGGEEIYGKERGRETTGQVDAVTHTHKFPCEEKLSSLSVHVAERRETIRRGIIANSPFSKKRGERPKSHRK